MIEVLVTPHFSVTVSRSASATSNRSPNLRDEFSAISCLEIIKQGFEVKIVIFYQKYSDLVNLVKILNKIIPRTLQMQSEIDFCKVEINNNLISKIFVFTEVLSKIAVNEKISFISLSLSLRD